MRSAGMSLNYSNPEAANILKVIGLEELVEFQHPSRSTIRNSHPHSVVNKSLAFFHIEEQQTVACTTIQQAQKSPTAFW